MNAPLKIDTTPAGLSRGAERQQAVFVIRQDCVKERQGLAAKFAAEAVRDNRPFDIVGYAAEAAKIQAFYDARERDLFPSPATELSAGRADPVFDNTTAAARYWGRI